MRLWSLLTLLFCLIVACQPKAKNPESFSLHLFQEPLHLDPARQPGSSSNYFFFNTLRGIYKINKHNKLVPEGGSCHWNTPIHLICSLGENYWSNGESVESADYIRSFLHLVDPKTASPRAHLLDQIVNAKNIQSGKMQPKQLAIKSLDKKRFEVFFENADSEFLYKLSSTAMYPRHKNHRKDRSDFKGFIVNGPYQIAKWDFGREIVLTPNPYYKKGAINRPIVKFYFIDDEMTAFRLYQAGKLDFLRRVPSKLISQLKERSDFHQIPVARFDYVGFGKDLKENSHLRKALAASVNYEELKFVLHALGRPGCPSIPSGWVDNMPCHEFNLKKAKEHYAKVPKKERAKTLHVKVSQMGGSDIKKQAEFFQNQWKKNLGVKTEIFQVENKTFINLLKASPPHIFRKGVSLDRPTCLNALETFSDNNKRNYINLNHSQYNNIVKILKTTPAQNKYRKLCEQALSILIDEAIVIPMGEIHFSILASPKYKGWSMNSLNQLDLSNLSPK